MKDDGEKQKDVEALTYTHGLSLTSMTAAYRIWKLLETPNTPKCGLRRIGLHDREGWLGSDP